MKLFPSAMCGVLLVLPLTAGSALAQAGSTAGSSTTKAQATPNAPSGSAPASEHGITSLTPGAPTPPAHPLTIDQTRELLELMGYRKMEEANWSQMIAMNKQAAPFIPNDVWTDVQTGISGIDYTAMMQPIYAKYLSQEDAAKAIEFYRTPAGRRVLQSMPPILGESVAASQQKGRQVGRDAIERHRAEIEVAQKKYQAEHTPAGGGTGAPGAGTPGPGAGTAQPSSPSPSTPPSGGAAAQPQR